MKIERTEHGFTWGDMELICMSEDDQGRVFLRIKRGKQTHQLYVTKSGKAVLHKEEQGK
jgi:hypothetical protein